MQSDMAYTSKDRLAMKNENMYKMLKGLLLHRLAEVDARYGGKAEVAKRMGVSESTIGRLAKQIRGERLSLKMALRLAEGLGIPMSEVIRIIAPEEAEILITLYDVDKEILPDMLKIALADKDAWQVIRSQVKFMASKIKD